MHFTSLCPGKMVQLCGESAICVCASALDGEIAVAPTGCSPLHLSPTTREHGTISNYNRDAPLLPPLGIFGTANHGLIQCSKAHSGYVHGLCSCNFFLLQLSEN